MHYVFNISYENLEIKMYPDVRWAQHKLVLEVGVNDCLYLRPSLRFKELPYLYMTLVHFNLSNVAVNRLSKSRHYICIPDPPLLFI